jgi:quercetin dioxygenase-like cupin family protein
VIIVHEDDVPGVLTEGEFKRTLKVLLSPLLDSGIDSIAAGLTILPPGGKSDFIGHVEGEMFYVLRGVGAMRVGEQTRPISVGTAIWIGPHEVHQMINKGSGDLKILWVLNPPGRESLILEQARAGAAERGSSE